MNVAVTGGTGFIGNYLLTTLLEKGYRVKAWYREQRDCRVEHPQLTWIRGDLESPGSVDELIDGCDAVVHGALWKPGSSFRSGSGDIVKFTEINVIGSIRLMEAAYRAGLKRFVFVSTCAVHEKILDDRMLDEIHPLWPLTHYGAHKAAIEKFVHSYGLGMGFPICAIRPSGVYGLHHQPSFSKWYELVRDVVLGKRVEVTGGGKEVHAADVAKACSILLEADPREIKGEAFSCCDRYISAYEVATIAKRIASSKSEIVGKPTTPKHQIETGKLESLGMNFGGTELLESTIGQMVESIKATP